MKTINIKCPFCEESLIITFDKNCEIESIHLVEDKLIPNEEIEEMLKNHGIEFG